MREMCAVTPDDPDDPHKTNEPNEECEKGVEQLKGAWEKSENVFESRFTQRVSKRA